MVQIHKRHQKMLEERKVLIGLNGSSDNNDGVAGSNNDTTAMDATAGNSSSSIVTEPTETSASANLGAAAVEGPSGDITATDEGAGQGTGTGESPVPGEEPSWPSKPGQGHDIAAGVGDWTVEEPEETADTLTTGIDTV